MLIFPPNVGAVCEKIGKNVYTQTVHNDSTLQRKRIAWLTKATNTLSQYVTHSDFPLPQINSNQCYVYIYTGCIVTKKKNIH
jgi:hypothetical protein